MKKKMLGFAAIMTAGLLMLCGCESSDTDTAGRNSQNASGTQQVSGRQVNGQDADGTRTEKEAASAEGSREEQGASDGEGATPAGTTQAADTSAENAAAEGTSSEAASAADKPAVQDIWSGTYIGGEEHITLALLADGNVSFSFAQSGITGTAEVKGSQAVYHGDDHYVIVFNIDGSILDVSVSSEEDEDASESPLIGTYIKEAE